MHHNYMQLRNAALQNKILNMAYTLSTNHTSLRAEDLYNYHVKKEEKLFTKFLNWCDAQESDHFLWLALTFFLQIGLTIPVTAFAILFFGGNNLLLWIIIVAANVPVLILSLAFFPTRIRLPFVFFSWLIQAAIIAYCIGFALIN